MSFTMESRTMLGKKVLFFRKNYPNYQLLDWDSVTVKGNPNSKGLVEIQWEDGSQSSVAVYALLPDTEANRRRLKSMYSRSREIYEEQRKITSEIDLLFGYHLPEAKEWANKRKKK